MKQLSAVLVAISVLLMSSTAMAGEKAAPKDVYDLVIKAYDVVAALKEDSLLLQRSKRRIHLQGHLCVRDAVPGVCGGPSVCHRQTRGQRPERKISISDHPLRRGQKPSGTWVEYKWPKPGSKEPSRKISFVIGVKDTPYTIAAGIYDDNTSITELNQGK